VSSPLLFAFLHLSGLYAFLPKPCSFLDNHCQKPHRFGNRVNPEGVCLIRNLASAVQLPSMIHNDQGPKSLTYLPKFRMSLGRVAKSIKFRTPVFAESGIFWIQLVVDSRFFWVPKSYFHFGILLFTNSRMVVRNF
jgi:hypothetical protein